MAAPGSPARPADARLAALAAAALLLSAIEFAIPKPLPYLRLGIANLPLILAAGYLGAGDMALLGLVKWLGAGFVSGTLFSVVSILSLAGTAASALAMSLTARALRSRGSFLSIALAGAMASNAAQLGGAAATVFGPAVALIAPPFLVMGLVTGTALGLFANAFARNSRYFAIAFEGEAPATGPDAPETEVPGEDPLKDGLPGSNRPPSRERAERRARAWDAAFDARSLAVGGALAAFSIAIESPMWLKLAYFASFIALTHLSGRKLRLVPSLVTMVSIVVSNLLLPAGRVIAAWGPFVVTETALLEGMERAIVFEGMLCVSLTAVRRGLRLPGRLGRILQAALGAYPSLISGGIAASRRGSGRFEPRRMIVAIDTALFSLAMKAGTVENEGRPGTVAPSRLAPVAFGAILLAVAIALSTGVAG
jgi:heptaprenyl diphosphate synthase